VVGWLVAQVAEFATENFGAPEWVLKIFVVFLILGLPMVLVFAWAFEMTPEGLKREKDVDRSESITQATGQKLNYTIIALLAVALAYFVWESRFAGDQRDMGSESDSQAASNQVESASDENLAPAPAVQPAQDNSIAVLPFANRSNLEDDLFFTDGIHDDLLTQLAKIRGLKVISRTSVMKFKDTQLTIPEIARELGVSSILEGGVQRAGRRIRINAQLIDVEHDQHLWAETFDREMTVENIFDIQSEITRQIVSAVRGELSEAESASLAQVPTHNLEAYEAYLQALARTNRADYVQDNYIQAEAWLNKAIGLDPEYAQAWVLLVEAHGQAAWMGYDSSPARMQAAKHALEQARKFGPGLSETLAAEGEYLYRIANDYGAAVEKYQAAALRAPGNARLLERLAVAQRRYGRYDDALGNFRRALDLDPGNSRTATLLADTLVTVNRYGEAIPLIEEWMRRLPDAMDLRAYRIKTYYEASGDLASARELLDSLQPWPGGEYAVQATFVPLLERDYPALIASYEIPEVQVNMSNRGWVGWDYWYRGFALRQLGDEPAAQAEFARCIEAIDRLEPTATQVDGFEQGFLARCHAGAGHFEEAVGAARRSEEILFAGGDQIFGAIALETRALVLGMAGRRDEALAILERLQAMPNGKPRWWLHLDPEWDFFRDDPRFVELSRPLNLDEARR